VLAASLSRNYKGMTVSAIEEELEADELNAMLGAIPRILEISGLVQKVPESGEAQAAESVPS